MSTDYSLTTAALHVILAIKVEGPRPDIHREIMERHRREWPALWRALDELREALGDT